MNAFQRRSDPPCGVLRRTQQTGRLQHQKRPQPLSAVENAVPHGAQQMTWAGDLALKQGVGQQRFQLRRHLLRRRFEP